MKHYINKIIFMNVIVGGTTLALPPIKIKKIKWKSLQIFFLYNL